MTPRLFTPPPRQVGWLLFLILALLTLSLPVLWISTRPVVPDFQPQPLLIDMRPQQEIYRITLEAAQTGWTSSLHRRVAGFYANTDDLASAIAHWEAALVLQPNDVNLLRQLAEHYLMLQDWSSAADTLRRLLVVLPNELWAHYQLGLILAPLNASEALLHLERVERTSAYGDIGTRLVLVLRSTLSDASKAMQIGIILSEAELWAQAEFAFRQAADLSFPDPEALAYVGLARGMQGKYGLDWLEQAVAIDPTSATVRYLEGVYLRSEGEYAGSLDAFSLALSFDPTNPAYYVELGNSYRRIGNLVQAEEWLQQAVTISENDPQFRQILNDFYLEEGASLTAAGIETVPVDLTNASAQADVAWTLYRLGAVEEANAALEEAFAIEAANPRALFYQARMLIDAGDLAAATANLEQVIEQGGDFAAEARSLLDTFAP